MTAKMENKEKAPLMEEIESLRREIESLKQEKAKHEEVKERLSNILENINDGVIYIDRHGTIIEINKKVEDIFGYTRKEIIGKSFAEFDLFDLKNAPKIAKIFYNTVKKGQFVDVMELEVKDKWGNKISVEVSTGVVKKKSRIEGIINVVRDISEQRKAIKKLAETEALESSILSAIPHAVIGLHERRIIFTNNAVKTVFGWKPEEVIGKNTRILYRTEEEYEEIASHFYPVLKKKQSFSEEFPCKHKDGKDIVCRVSASRIGKTLKEKRIVVVYEDITEQKQKVKLLEESEERLKVIMDSLQIGIMLVDAEKHEIVDVNPAAIKMFGAPKEKIIGSVCHSFICPAEIGKCPISDLGQTVDNSERVLLNVKSETVPILKTVLPITLNGRKVLLESFVDITDSKLAEEKLKQSFVNLAETISRAMSSKDPYTADHQRKVAELAYLVGEKMGIEKNKLQWLYIGGLLHDIGKVSIPEGILSKPGKLIKEELDLVYGHTRQGYEILKDSNLPCIVPELALHHHERMDGSGYPDGITGDDMSQEVRILAVCDVVDAMNSHRPYRPSRTKKEILKELKDGRGIKYDAKIVDIVIKLIKSGEYEIEDRNIY